jgi:hypothetical protein
MGKSLTDPKWWSSAWRVHHQRYVSRPSYQAYYLDCILPKGAKQLLELGAGSFRDTAQLNKWGYECIGTDFSAEAVALAQCTYPQWAHRFQVADATALPFDCRRFDFSFHSGLFACFEEDTIINAILQEQARVSRFAIVCTVHNALNISLREQFRHHAQSDPLYRVRFFTPEEITELMRPFCVRISLYPFGALGCNRLIKYGRSRFLTRAYYRITHKRWRWENCERIMAVGWLS